MWRHNAAACSHGNSIATASSATLSPSRVSLNGMFHQDSLTQWSKLRIWKICDAEYIKLTRQQSFQFRLYITAFAKLRRHVGFYRCWLVKSDVMSSNIGFSGRCDSWTQFRVSWWQWSIKTRPFHTQKSSIFQWNYAWKPTWPWQIRLWWWAKMRELTNLRSAPVCRNFLLVIQARISKM